jgi:hypothetical protein
LVAAKLQKTWGDVEYLLAVIRGERWDFNDAGWGEERGKIGAQGGFIATGCQASARPS